MIWEVILVIACYFIGNISPSAIIAKSKGIDIHQAGSGNAGTTNALRVLGGKAAGITLLIDMGKGALCTFLGVYFYGTFVGCVCALAVFLGHIFPAIYSFKGGKGAATAVGAMLVLDWRITLIVVAIAAVSLLISKRMSVGSLLGAISFPFVTWALNEDLLPLAIIIAVFIILKHISNIKRIFKGEEPIMSIFDKSKKSSKN